MSTSGTKISALQEYSGTLPDAAVFVLSYNAANYKLTLAAMKTLIGAGQVADATLTALAGLTGAGYIKASATDTFSMASSIPVSDLTGTLPVTQGGTGVTSLSALAAALGLGTAATYSADAFAAASHNHDWASISGKPSTFAPSAHSHDWASVTDKPSAFAPSAHTHLWADITDKPTTFAPSAHSHDWASITSKPSTFAPSAHGHDWADITSKPSTFTPSSHTHPADALTLGGLTGSGALTWNGTSWSLNTTLSTVAWADITDKPSSFTPSAHGHAWSEITDKPVSFPPSIHTHAGTDIVGNVIELGVGNSTNPVLFDFHTADDTYPDYSARLLRDGGANGVLFLHNRGSGEIVITAETGHIGLFTNDVRRLDIDPSGTVSISGSAVFGADPGGSENYRFGGAIRSWGVVTGSVDATRVICSAVSTIGYEAPWTQGAYTFWNRTGGSGATTFCNHPGVGGGGFEFGSWVGGVFKQNMFLTQDSALVLYPVAGEGAEIQWLNQAGYTDFVTDTLQNSFRVFGYNAADIELSLHNTGPGRMNLYAEGNLYANDNQLATSTSALGLSTEAYFLRVGGQAGQHLAFDYYRIQAKNTATWVSDLYLQPLGGSAIFGADPGGPEQVRIGGSLRTSGGIVTALNGDVRHVLYGNNGVFETHNLGAGVSSYFFTDGAGSLRLYNGSNYGVLIAPAGEVYLANGGVFAGPSGYMAATRFCNGTFWGTSQANARNHFHQYNAGNAGWATGWIAAAFGDSTAPRVVIGQADGKAVLGAHTADLGTWAPLYLGWDSPLIVGTSDPGGSERLRINGAARVAGDLVVTGSLIATGATASVRAPVVAATGVASVAVTSTYTIPASVSTVTITGTGSGMTITLPYGPHPGQELVVRKDTSGPLYAVTFKVSGGGSFTESAALPYNLTAGQAITFRGTATGGWAHVSPTVMTENIADATADGKALLKQTTSTMRSTLAINNHGFRNRILNPRFRINERGFASGGTTSIGSYTRDRWICLGGNQSTVTISGDTLTLSAATYLCQIVDVEATGTYYITHDGTCARGVSTTYKGLNTTSSSVFASAGSTITVTFQGPGTIVRPQLCLGAVTEFEYRPDAVESLLCAAYFESSGGLVRRSCGAAGFGGNSYGGSLYFRTPKKVVPTASQVSIRDRYGAAGSVTIYKGGVAYDNQSGLTDYISKFCFDVYAHNAPVTDAGMMDFSWAVDVDYY